MLTKKAKAVRRTALSLVLALGLGATVIGCGNTAAAPTASPGAPAASGSVTPEPLANNKIRIGIITAGAVRPALVVAANELGYYRDEGLDVELVPIDSVNSALTAIATDKLDVLPYAVVPTLSAIAQGGNYVIFAGTATEGSVMATNPANAGVDFRDFNNWAGKKIAYARTSTTIELLKEHIASTGFDLSKVEWVEISASNETLEAIKKGTVDAGFLTQEAFWVGEQAGLVEAFQIAEFLPNYVCCRQTADLTRLDQNREAYIRLIKAQLRAEWDYANDLDKVVNAVAKYIEQDPEYVRQYIGTDNGIGNTGGLVQYKNLVSPDPLFNKVKALYDVSIRSGVFEEKTGVELKEHVDISVFEEAVNRLIAEHPDDATYRRILELYQKDNTDY